MATLSFLLAAALDPVQAAIVLAVLIIYRGPQPIILAGATATLAAETLLALAAVHYTWGEVVAPRLVASLIQAALLCWLIRLFGRLRVTGVARSGVGAFSSPPVASLRSLSTRSTLHRPAPWHMRAYVRRRIYRLRSR
jgi:hypothetical protein